MLFCCYSNKNIDTKDTQDLGRTKRVEIGIKPRKINFIFIQFLAFPGSGCLYTFSACAQHYFFVSKKIYNCPSREIFFSSKKKKKLWYPTQVILSNHFLAYKKSFSRLSQHL